MNTGLTCGRQHSLCSNKIGRSPGRTDGARIFRALLHARGSLVRTCCSHSRSVRRDFIGRCATTNSECSRRPLLMLYLLFQLPALPCGTLQAFIRSGAYQLLITSRRLSKPDKDALLRLTARSIPPVSNIMPCVIRVVCGLQTLHGIIPVFQRYTAAQFQWNVPGPEWSAHLPISGIP